LRPKPPSTWPMDECGGRSDSGNASRKASKPSEYRKLFAAMLDKLGLPPDAKRISVTPEAAVTIANKSAIQFLVRPSFVLAGAERWSLIYNKKICSAT